MRKEKELLKEIIVKPNAELISLQTSVRDLRKQIDDLKKENSELADNVKFTHTSWLNLELDGRRLNRIITLLTERLVNSKSPEVTAKLANSIRGLEKEKIALVREMKEIKKLLRRARKKFSDEAT